MNTPKTAMVLAAGLGKRMRPITDTIPKPLVPVAGKTLLDWGLDSLAQAGVDHAVVNVHYLADQIAAHVSGRLRPKISLSQEPQLLDSAGGIVGALPLLGPQPFFIVNADTFWIDRGVSNLGRLAARWDRGRMDILLMLADPRDATGHAGGTDFHLQGDNRLLRSAGAPDGLIYAGAAILDPKIFAGATSAPHSLNLYFDRAIAAGRLFGVLMQGDWITVGTPDAIAPAERVVADALASRR